MKQIERILGITAICCLFLFTAIPANAQRRQSGKTSHSSSQSAASYYYDHGLSDGRQYGRAIANSNQIKHYFQIVASVRGNQHPNEYNDESLFKEYEKGYWKGVEEKESTPSKTTPVSAERKKDYYNSGLEMGRLMGMTTDADIKHSFQIKAAVKGGDDINNKYLYEEYVRGYKKGAEENSGSPTKTTPVSAATKKAYFNEGRSKGRAYGKASTERILDCFRVYAAVRAVGDEYNNKILYQEFTRGYQLGAKEKGN